MKPVERSVPAKFVSVDYDNISVLEEKLGCKLARPSGSYVLSLEEYALLDDDFKRKYIVEVRDVERYVRPSCAICGKVIKKKTQYFTISTTTAETTRKIGGEYISSYKTQSVDYAACGKRCLSKCITIINDETRENGLDPDRMLFIHARFDE